MSFITEPSVFEVNFDGIIYAVNPAFDIILDIQNLFNEPELSDVEKLDIALELLIAPHKKVVASLAKLSPCKKNELLGAIYDACVKPDRRRPASKKNPIVDFDLDGDYIYASFLMDYGLDLIDQQGILSFKKFTALFQGLSKNTKIKEVMRIRDMDIPKFNGKNSKEIADLQELKSYYALPVKGGGGAKGLDLLFSALENMV